MDINEACQQLKLYCDELYNKWRIEANLSGLQLREQSLIESINNALKDANVSSEMLELEFSFSQH